MTTKLPRAKDRPRIRQETAEGAASRLETSIRRYERRYERSSEDMLAATKQGKVKETAEIAKWLMNYRALRNLRAHGNTTGIPMKTTK